MAVFIFLIDAITIRPVLVDSTPRISPIIENLAPEEMTPRPPHMFILPSIHQPIMVSEDRIDIIHFERHVIQSIFVTLETHEHVMIDIFRALIEATERRNNI
ncbi:hypothetical protein BG60_18390 [Caballeronia zhejiangensis]|uniref:Uncharacterized protein n=1 Tax=Caballeronia zhejiangensis TaxID=871203 RepID=A0A656QC87_9BURK|nr:hypothetical protein BG60_18390 [Caballeronia zhejiangensis]